MMGRIKKKLKINESADFHKNIQSFLCYALILLILPQNLNKYFFTGTCKDYMTTNSQNRLLKYWI